MKFSVRLVQLFWNIKTLVNFILEFSYKLFFQGFVLGGFLVAFDCQTKAVFPQQIQCNFYFIGLFVCIVITENYSCKILSWYFATRFMYSPLPLCLK